MASAKLRLIAVRGVDGVEAVRARLLGSFRDTGTRFELVLLAFRGVSDGWPVVLNDGELGASRRPEMDKYARRKTRFWEAKEYPFEDRNIVFPAATGETSATGMRRPERPQSWTGTVRFARPAPVGCASIIDLNLAFEDSTGQRREVAGRVGAVRAIGGEMPWNRGESQ